MNQVALHNMRRRGFTLIELLVVIAIIALLLGITIVGLSGAFTAGRSAADAQAARTLGVAVEQFKQQVGFDVPLLFDGDPQAETADAPASVFNRFMPVELGSEPVFENGSARFVAAYSRGADLDFLRGVTVQPTITDWSDPRYSKTSLPVYLAGTLPSSVDRVDGPGMSKPKADGSFSNSLAGALEPFVEPGARGVGVVTNYANENEYEEHGAAGFSASSSERDFATAIVDANGIAYRYYRWESGRNSVDAGGLNTDDYGKTENSKDFNIPLVLLDPVKVSEQYGLIGSGDPRVDATDGNIALRSARWAIVGAGPDGLFGTEPLDVLADAMGKTVPGDPEVAAGMRADAMADNVVELGQ